MRLNNCPSSGLWPTQPFDQGPGLLRNLLVKIHVRLQRISKLASYWFAAQLPANQKPFGNFLLTNMDYTILGCKKHRNWAMVTGVSDITGPSDSMDHSIGNWTISKGSKNYQSAKNCWKLLRYLIWDFRIINHFIDFFSFFLLNEITASFLCKMQWKFNMPLTSCNFDHW